MFRSIWAASEVEASPALKFLHPRQRVELAPQDAERLGVSEGEQLVVGSAGQTISGVAFIRAGALEGTVSLETAIPADDANGLQGPLVEVRRA
jgi:anaerobic selenocysteine-containing dehydrogenase